MVKILLAEDEIVLGKLVKEALAMEADWDVEWVEDGLEALSAFQTNTPDVCVFDIMMPYMDGLSLVEKIRSINQRVPIIFLTAKAQLSDLEKGYLVGGNDYLKKPFSIVELKWRIKELLKRQVTSESETAPTQNIYRFGNFEFDAIKQTLSSKKHFIELSYRESELLKLLVIDKNNILDRSFALQSIWGSDNFFNARNMDVYIAKLRKFLQDDETVKIINVRGLGFKLIEI